MQQIFIDRALKIDEIYEFDEPKAHHLMHVLRIAKDTKVRLVHEQAYLANIDYQDGKVIARVIDIDERNNELKCNLILVQAMIKKEKWELVLQKASELGCTTIIPLLTKRTIVDDRRFADKRVRYEKILLEAAQQCKRNQVCTLLDPINLKDLDVYGDLKMVAYEDLDQKASKIHQLYQKQENIVIVIGPEGGFDPSEIALLKTKGYQCVSLGNRILRSETASMYALSVIGELTE
ncbi:MAG: 16S rRNA (uracil(1498)-N(3))-methyltransferase [Erysipelotrichaceae bacterium]|nr:16S rRNA (uracil(1498)-N(3))-methyltransferase [Erysipelotrichaceae bacterium]MDY5252249.1 RsmE family RNA methyltransferase [Erysipelotrichaceae bacterium]